MPWRYPVEIRTTILYLPTDHCNSGYCVFYNSGSTTASSHLLHQHHTYSTCLYPYPPCSTPTSPTPYLLYLPVHISTMFKTYFTNPIPTLPACTHIHHVQHLLHQPHTYSTGLYPYPPYPTPTSLTPYLLYRPVPISTISNTYFTNPIPTLQACTHIHHIQHLLHQPHTYSTGLYPYPPYPTPTSPTPYLLYRPVPISTISNTYFTNPIHIPHVSRLHP